MVADLMASHTAMTASRNQSHLFHSTTIMATTAAMARGIHPIAATTAPIAGITVPDTKAITPEIAAAICGTTVIIVPMAPTTLPMMISTGATAAATRAMVTIIFFVPSSSPFSQSTSPWIHPTISRMEGMRISPTEIASSSSWLFKIVSCPARLSCMVAAIFSAVPSQLLMASFSF